MAITWRPPPKRRCVVDVLAAHPVEKPWCLEAARYLHPLARHQDPDARFWLLRPHPECGPAIMIEEGSIGIQPKTTPSRRWAYHVCVETEEHCLCVLTHESGTPKGAYLTTHFQEPDDVLPYMMNRIEDVEAKVFAIGRRRS